MDLQLYRSELLSVQGLLEQTTISAIEPTAIRAI